MSTKDISRSALEGGRANNNKHERNESHRHERSRTKVWLDTVRFDSETAEDSDPQPRNPVRKDFTDKLNPCWRWLASHCGQPWADVYSKLAGSFDTRKLSAWHIVNQHMLAEISGAGTSSDGLGVTSWRFQRFFIDDEGVLRDHGERRRTYHHKPEYSGPSETSVMAYANGRKVIDNNYSNTRWWALPGEPQWDSCKFKEGRCTISRHLHRKVETTSATLVERYKTAGLRSLGNGGWWRTYSIQHLVNETWRAHKKFTKAEMKWWELISYDIRGMLTISR